MDNFSHHPPEGIVSESFRSTFTPEAPAATLIEDRELIPTPYIEDLIDMMVEPSRLGIEALDGNTDADIQDAFDWHDVLNKVGKLRNLPPDMDLDLHLIVFRSTRLPEAQTVEMSLKLDDADIDAFREAMYAAPSAFLYYYRNDGLSFCLWTNSRDARKATNGPAHEYAKALAPEMYEAAQIEAYDIARRENGTTIEIAPKYTINPLEHIS